MTEVTDPNAAPAPEPAPVAAPEPAPEPAPAPAPEPAPEPAPAAPAPAPDEPAAPAPAPEPVDPPDAQTASLTAQERASDEEGAKARLAIGRDPDAEPNFDDVPGYPGLYVDAPPRIPVALRPTPAGPEPHRRRAETPTETA